MLDSRFIEAFVHNSEERNVFGRVLHPLCAQDILQLEIIGSPLLYREPTDADLKHVLLSAWIMGGEHKPGPERPPISITPDHAWFKEASEHAIHEPETLTRAWTLLKAHFKDYYSPPEVMTAVAEEQTTPLGTLWIVSVVMSFWKKGTVSLREVWLMPIGELLWYSAALSELESDTTRVVTEELEKSVASTTTDSDEGHKERVAKQTGIPIEILNNLRCRPTGGSPHFC